jgi:hypothetical protein
MLVPTLTGAPSTTSAPNGAALAKTPLPASIAFGLGCHMGQLYHFQWGAEQETDAVDSLPGISQLPVTARADLLRIQIGVALEKLGHAELGDDLQARGQGDTAVPAVSRETVYAFHMRVLPRLTAEESSLGKAYDLGRALAETALSPGLPDAPAFGVRFSAGAVQLLKSELSDLRGRFPVHACEAVEMSLDAWQQWVKEKKLDPDPSSWNPKQERAVAQALRRQGEVWYALLVGDMDPARLLTVNDYLAAIKSIFTAISGIAWSFLAKIGVRRGPIAILLLSVIAVFALFKLTNQVFAIIGPLFLLIGLLGITVGAVTSSLRQALQQAGAGLWDAELLNSIAHAVIYLPQL